MCQLLGMNCNTPTDICFSFAGFQARGGLTDIHGDGWGIAFFEGRGVRVFLDPQASSTSRVADLVRHYPIHSLNVISHIRKATQGLVSLENTHPFQRELWGRYWVFAHNGNLHGFSPELFGQFTPVGQTDSEHAFCYLLEALRRAGATFADEGAAECPGDPITKADLFALGLTGGTDSAAKRRALLKQLDLPEHLTPNGMLEALNLLYSREEFLSRMVKTQ